MIIPMLCVTIFVILVVWFLLPRVARLMIHTPTAISIRSEERFSRNAETDLVCRLLLEKKKNVRPASSGRQHIGGQVRDVPDACSSARGVETDHVAHEEHAHQDRYVL